MKAYGLLIETTLEHGTTYVRARLIAREEGKDHPVNPGSNGIGSWDNDEPKQMIGLFLDGLEMTGHIAKYNASDIRFISHGIEYRNVYSICRDKIAMMARTMKRLDKQIANDLPREPGDWFMTLANAFKLSFVVQKTSNSYGSSYADHNWEFMTLMEGRNRFRYLIQKAIEENKPEKTEA